MLQTQYQNSIFQIINGKLLATSKQEQKRIEILNLYAEKSVYYDNVFQCGNDLPMSFIREGNFYVIGGDGREINSCQGNAEVAKIESKTEGFEAVTLNETYFPNAELDGKPLLSV